MNAGLVKVNNRNLILASLTPFFHLHVCFAACIPVWGSFGYCSLCVDLFWIRSQLHKV